MGMAPNMEIRPNNHHAVIIILCSSPHVNAAPPTAGPTARPIALILTAKPFRVPRMRRLEAEFVNRMMAQGKAKMTAKDLTSMMANMASCCVRGWWMRAVKGVRKQIRGKVQAQILKQRRMP
jgi:hypothetical protein